MYENRQPAEDINVTRVHPLKQFIQLAIAAIVLIVALVYFLQVSGSWMAKRIPFSFEVDVMQELEIPFGDNAAHPQMVIYLNDLAQRVVANMPTPEGVDVIVHYSDDNVFNAFATVGGNLLFYKGLLQKMPDENTLAMVMAHEIAHVLHRDPIASLGGGIVSTVALLGLTGSTGTAGSVLNNAGALTSVQFTRRMEELADEAAIAALNGLYGHVNGASTLFELFGEARGANAEPAGWLEGFASTHPGDADRVQRTQERAQLEGWSVDGELTPLPADFKRWM